MANSFTVLLVRHRDIISPNMNPKQEVKALLTELRHPPIKSVPIDPENMTAVGLETTHLGYSYIVADTNETKTTLSNEDFYETLFSGEHLTDYCSLIAYSQEEMKYINLLVAREYTLQGLPVPTNVDVITHISSDVEDELAALLLLNEDQIGQLQRPDVEIQLIVNI